MRWSGIQLSLRATCAAIVSLAIAELMALDYPIYAFIAAIIVTDLKPETSRRLGWIRLAATVIGAVSGATLSYVLPPGILSVGLGTLAAMVLADLLKANEGVKVAGYISGIVLLEHGAEPLSYAFMRFVETVIGVVVAWGMSYVPKLVSSSGE